MTRRTLAVAVGWYDLAALTRFEAATGVRPDVVSPTMDDLNIGWNGNKVKPFLEHGVIPERTWSGGTVPLAEIAAGKWDKKINEHARWSASSGVHLRPWHEMNGPWSRNYGDPATYIAAWKRARKIYRDAGNLGPWIWTPNITDNGVNPFEAYYPGDDQCELVGLDGYSYPKAGNKTFAAIFDADLAKLGKLSARPLTIGETGVSKLHTGRAQWITDMFAYLIAHPRVERLLYWNRDDYDITGDVAACAAFDRGVRAWRY